MFRKNKCSFFSIGLRACRIGLVDLWWWINNVPFINSVTPISKICGCRFSVVSTNFHTAPNRILPVALGAPNFILLWALSPLCCKPLSQFAKILWAPRCLCFNLDLLSHVGWFWFFACE
jgi:hypothetical protein